MEKKSFLEKMLGKAKYGVAAVLAAGVIAGLGSLAYAKEINHEGWPLPDETQYLRLADPSIKEIPCEYKGQTLNVKVKIEPYVNQENLRSYLKYSFEDQVFMYVLLGLRGDGVLILDRDGDGSLETKYDIEKDEEEFKKDGFIPRWILEKVLNR